MDEEIKDLVMKAGGLSIGPMKVAMALLAADLQTGRLALEMAIDADVVGGELWLLYKDVHQFDLAATRESLCLKQAVGELSQLPYSKHFTQG